MKTLGKGAIAYPNKLWHATFCWVVKSYPHCEHTIGERKLAGTAQKQQKILQNNKRLLNYQW